MVYEDEVRDRFERDVDIVRGAGGFAPTTDDLRWLGEAEAHESIRRAEYLDAGVTKAEEALGFALMRLEDAWSWRDDPEVRERATASVRAAIVDVRRLRGELAAAEALRRERTEEGV